MKSLRRGCAALAVLPLLLATPSVQGAGIPGFVVIPYQVIANRYILRCTLNGIPMNMLIDSGSSHSLIDKDTFNRAIPKDQQVAPSGVAPKIRLNGVQLPVYMTKNLKIGNLTLGDGPVGIHDMAEQNFAARHYARELANERGIETVVIDGIMGLDILRTYNAVIDTSRHVLYLNPDRSHRGGLLGDKMGGYGFKRVKLIYSSGNIEAPCSLQGKPGRLYVDTGAFLTILDYKYVRSANVSIRPTAMKMGLGLGGHGETAVFVSQPTDFKIGDYTYPPSSIACQGLDFNMMGLLGPELMEKAHAIIDFGNMSMFLK